MTYKISDEQFLEELRVNAFINQVTGYLVGQRSMSFKPIITTTRYSDREINRELTLDGPAYTFTEEERARLLELANDQTGDCTAETK